MSEWRNDFKHDRSRIRHIALVSWSFLDLAPMVLKIIHPFLKVIHSLASGFKIIHVPLDLLAS